MIFNVDLVNPQGLRLSLSIASGSEFEAHGAAARSATRHAEHGRRGPWFARQARQTGLEFRVVLANPQGLTLTQIVPGALERDAGPRAAALANADPAHRVHGPWFVQSTMRHR